MQYPLSQHNRFIRLVLGGLVIAVVVGLLLARLSGLQLLSVQSHTMAPALRPGDVVVVRPARITSLQIGDLVSLHELAHPGLVITHRVIAVDRHRQLVTTKGDSAAVAELPINQQLLVGRVAATIPKLGYLLAFFRSLPGLGVTTYLPALLLAGLELRNLSTDYVPSYRLRQRFR